MKQLKMGLIGLGNRGACNLKILLNIPNVTVTAVCDHYADRVEAAEKLVLEAGAASVFKTDDAYALIAHEDVDVVLVFTSWEWHVEYACAAMQAGKPVGVEVGGAYSINDCWRLVDVYEKTKTPIMLLENCCYNHTELMVTNMVRDGLFGELVYCHGCYGHDLRGEITGGKENRHYRLRNYMYRNCENYPTHELGPIAKLLNINHGNRMLSLVSVSSKSIGLRRYVEEHQDTLPNKDLIGRDFAQGDIVNTLITCANGETISLRLDTTTPRPYSREFTVRGTKGMYEENTNSVFLDGGEECFATVEHYKKVIDNATEYREKYLPDYWKNVTQEEKDRGHGGMDYFMFLSFIDAVANDKPMPIDVYDMASWMVVSCLSEQSIAQGNCAVSIPDFTNGKWILDNPEHV